MDFRLDDEQLELRETVRRFCAARFPLEGIARREARPLDRAVWREIAGVGVFALLAPERAAGDAFAIVDAAIVFEQLGAHLVPGPVLWSTLAAPLVDGAAAGERIVGGFDGTGGVRDPILVEHAGEIDALLMLRDEGVFTAAAPEPSATEACAPLDPQTPVARLAELPAGARVGDAQDAARLRRIGTVLGAAMLLGIAESALESARRYALDREQFGVPIGSFQAVQHLLADMYVRSALARSSVYAAAAVLDEPSIGDPARAGSAAKLLAGEAALENARVAIQVHGGIGFTWEMVPHWLLKRAWVLEHGFGDSEAHAAALGRSLEEALA